MRQPQIEVPSPWLSEPLAAACRILERAADPQVGSALPLLQHVGADCAGYGCSRVALTLTSLPELTVIVRSQALKPDFSILIV